MCASFHLKTTANCLTITLEWFDLCTLLEHSVTMHCVCTGVQFSSVVNAHKL